MRSWMLIALLLVGVMAGCSSGTSTIPKDGKFEYMRDGVDAVIEYHPEWNAFRGIVYNESDESLLNVRVKVRLSNGIELGPTEPVHLAPEQWESVSIETTDDAFDSWSARIEVGQRGFEVDSEQGPGSEVAGDMIPKDADYEVAWNGMQIGIGYVSNLGGFGGVVHNVSDESLLNVRVKVRLSNGIELGPTDPVHLAPDQFEGVGLKVTDDAFDSWSARIEVGQRGFEADSAYGPGGEGSDSG